MGMREWDGEKWVHKSGGIGTGGNTGEIPSKLPNPYPLTINGQSYDGSESVEMITPRRVEVVIYDNGDETGTSSHTYEEIKALSDAGWTIVGRIDRKGYQGLVIGVMSVDEDIAAISAIAPDGKYYAAAITRDDVMTGEVQIMPVELPSPNALIINGQGYNGSEMVDFTETINGMIDDKLGVIENGAY